MVPVLGTENVPIFGTFFFRKYGFRNAPESLRERIVEPKCSSPFNFLEHLDADQLYLDMGKLCWLYTTDIVGFLCKAAPVFEDVQVMSAIAL